jgi:hypothetical protein
MTAWEVRDLVAPTRRLVQTTEPPRTKLAVIAAGFQLGAHAVTNPVVAENLQGHGISPVDQPGAGAVASGAGYAW